MRCTLDTNVLVYTTNAADPKHATAVELLRRVATADCVQPMQTFGEFFHVVTRKYRYPVADAAAAVDRFRTLMRTVLADEGDFDAAVRLCGGHKVQFWDAHIWATARRAGARVLFTEDMNDGQDLEGVRIVNPFNDANRTLVDLVLPAAEQGNA